MIIGNLESLCLEKVVELIKKPINYDEHLLKSIFALIFLAGKMRKRWDGFCCFIQPLKN